MVDKNLLYSKVVSHGENWLRLCDHLGVYSATLHKKLRGDTNFKDCEIQKIMNLYSLTPEEVVTIFFTKEAV